MNRRKGGKAHFLEDLAQPGSGGIASQQIFDSMLINDTVMGDGVNLRFSKDNYTMIQLNITSLTDLYLFLPAMVEKGEGGVINIGSSASFSVPMQVFILQQKHMFNVLVL